MKSLFSLIFLFGSLTLVAKTAYQVYRMPSTGTVATWGAVDLGQSAARTGVLPFANGGTGASSFAAGIITSTGSAFASVSNITIAQLPASNNAISASTGTINISAGLNQIVAAATLTTHGRPVRAFVQPDGSATLNSVLSTGGQLKLKLIRDGTVIALSLAGVPTVASNVVPYFSYLDLGASAASHTYQLEVDCISPTTCSVQNVVIGAIEE